MSFESHPCHIKSLNSNHVQLISGYLLEHNFLRSFYSLLDEGRRSSQHLYHSSGPSCGPACGHVDGFSLTDILQDYMDIRQILLNHLHYLEGKVAPVLTSLLSNLNAPQVQTYLSADGKHQIVHLILPTPSTSTVAANLPQQPPLPNLSQSLTFSPTAVGDAHNTSLTDDLVSPRKQRKKAPQRVKAIDAASSVSQNEVVEQSEGDANYWSLEEVFNELMQNADVVAQHINLHRTGATESHEHHDASASHDRMLDLLPELSDILCEAICSPMGNLGTTDIDVNEHSVAGLTPADQTLLVAEPVQDMDPFTVPCKTETNFNMVSDYVVGESLSMACPDQTARPRRTDRKPKEIYSPSTKKFGVARKRKRVGGSFKSVSFSPIRATSSVTKHPRKLSTSTHAPIPPLRLSLLLTNLQQRTHLPYSRTELVKWIASRLEADLPPPFPACSCGENSCPTIAFAYPEENEFAETTVTVKLHCEPWSVSLTGARELEAPGPSSMQAVASAEVEDDYATGSSSKDSYVSHCSVMTSAVLPLAVNGAQTLISPVSLPQECVNPYPLIGLENTFLTTSDTSTPSTSTSQMKRSPKTIPRFKDVDRFLKMLHNV